MTDTNDMRSKFDKSKFANRHPTFLYVWEEGYQAGAASVQGEQKPVAWQTREKWSKDTIRPGWQAWEGCTEQTYNECLEYIKNGACCEVRKLYAAPLPQGEQCPSEWRVEENVPMDRFENAIREIGIIAACEWFGYASDSEFTVSTIAELARRVLKTKEPT